MLTLVFFVLIYVSQCQQPYLLIFIKILWYCFGCVKIYINDAYYNLLQMFFSPNIALSGSIHVESCSSTSHISPVAHILLYKHTVQFITQFFIHTYSVSNDPRSSHTKTCVSISIECVP